MGPGHGDAGGTEGNSGAEARAPGAVVPAAQSRCLCSAIFAYCSLAGPDPVAALWSYCDASAHALATSSDDRTGAALATGASIGEQVMTRVSEKPETLQMKLWPRQSACHDVVCP